MGLLSQQLNNIKNEDINKSPDSEKIKPNTSTKSKQVFPTTPQTTSPSHSISRIIGNVKFDNPK